MQGWTVGPAHSSIEKDKLHYPAQGEPEPCEHLSS
jgi:hypothetical protein